MLRILFAFLVVRVGNSECGQQRTRVMPPWVWSTLPLLLMHGNPAIGAKRISDTVSVTITRPDKYRFLVDFGPGIATSIADEPAPLGNGDGPSPPQLLAAAVANCLSASLVFAHGKFKEDAGRLRTTATCEIGRNEKNRLRISGIKVAITLGVAPESLGHLDQALAQFEDFCPVSQSVRSGILFIVTVRSPDGRVLK